ncbi:hypothetical protein [Paenibacillus agri]|nr:hypothetical protein [Paenibacillus agri]
MGASSSIGMSRSSSGTKWYIAITAVVAAASAPALPVLPAAQN